MGIGNKAKMMSVRILMTLFVRPRSEYVVLLKHFVVGNACNSAFHDAAIGEQLKMRVPAQARAKQVRKTINDQLQSYVWSAFRLTYGSP